MKMLRNLIILVAIAVLVAAFVIIAPKLQPAKTAAPTSTPDPALLQLSTMTADKVSEVTVQTAAGTYTIAKSGSNYVVKGQESLALDQSLAGSLVTNAATVTGERLIPQSSVTDLSAFGLSKPQATVTSKYTDGSTAVFLLGDKTSGGDTYYMMKQGDQRVLTVAAGVGDSYLAALATLMTKEVFTLTQDDIQNVKVLKNDAPVLEMSSTGDTSNVAMVSWMIEQPWKRYVDAQQLDTYLKAILAATMDSIVDGNPADLSKYGLDKPVYDITISGKGKTNELLVGAEKDDSYTYAKFADSNTVYQVSTSLLSFTSTSAVMLMDKTIVLVNMTSGLTTGVEFQGLGQQGKMVIAQTPSKDETGAVKKDSNGAQIFDQAFSINGKAIDDKVARYFYETCIGLQTHSPIDNKGWQPSGDPVAVLTYDRSADPTQIKIEFLAYDADFYAVRMNGSTDFLILKDKVQEIADDVAKLAAGTLTVPSN